MEKQKQDVENRCYRFWHEWPSVSINDNAEEITQFVVRIEKYISDINYSDIPPWFLRFILDVEHKSNLRIIV